MRFINNSLKYDYDVAYLRSYGSDTYKLSVMRCVRKSGYEIKNFKKKCSVNDSKLEENIIRARSKLFEYAYCNDFEYFLTITLDSKKYNRQDLNKFNKDLSQFIRNYNKKYNLNIKRIFVPEKHRDGCSWHMHGFIMGLPLSHLRLFSLDEKLPKYIREKLLKGQNVYEWVAYREKFGFNDFEHIRNKEACSKYITKYITKELANSVTTLNAHLFYASKGLSTSKLIKKGSLRFGLSNPHYENDYCKGFWLKSSDEKSLTHYFVD